MNVRFEGDDKINSCLCCWINMILIHSTLLIPYRLHRKAEIEARVFMLNHFRHVARRLPECRKPNRVAESAYLGASL